MSVEIFPRALQQPTERVQNEGADFFIGSLTDSLTKKRLERTPYKDGVGSRERFSMDLG